MDCKAVATWGAYGADNATQRANLAASFGLMESLPDTGCAHTSVLEFIFKARPEFTFKARPTFVFKKGN